MHIDRQPAAVQRGFRRLETLSFESTIPQGARFLTQAGYLEVTFYAPGIIRLRLETKREVDYGLLVPAPAPVHVDCSPVDDGFRLEAQEVALELRSDPVAELGFQ